MLATSHTAVGAALSALARSHPVVAFGLGVASHFALDAIPHWGAAPNHPIAPDQFITVARRDGVSALILSGFALAISPFRLATAAAVVGAVAPDANMPLEHFFKARVWPATFERFHSVIQSEHPSRLRRDAYVAAVLSILALGTLAAARRAS